MESSKTFAQRLIEKSVAARTVSLRELCTYTDTGYNDCDGTYYDTDD